VKTFRTGQYSAEADCSAASALDAGDADFSSGAGENLFSKSSTASDRGKCYPSNQRMVYLKSFLAGVLALVSALLLSIAGLLGWALWMSHTSSNEGSVGAVGYDISSPWVGIPRLTFTAFDFLGRHLLGVSKSEAVAEKSLTSKTGEKQHQSQIFE
jgi:hypothetical protein